MTVFVYYSAHEKSNLVKVGLTQHDTTGLTRIKDYARRHGLPTTGWTTPKHFALNTDDWTAGLAVEKAVHTVFRLRGAFIKYGGRATREAFKGTRSTAHWACLRAAEESGLYIKRS